MKRLALVLLVCSCGRYAPVPPAQDAAVPVYHTWQSLHERAYGEPLAPVPAEVPPRGFFPWAGVASHHLLTHDYLDAWFSCLAEMRTPRVFYILSPAHYGVALEPYSLTAGSWESGFGLVESDGDKARELAGRLEVELDDRAFQVEHGVSTFMPYIKKYFPGAKVVAIAYEGEPPVHIPASGRLAEIIKSEFDEAGKRENFLLISTDFSHHAGPEETRKRDYFSERYLRNPGVISWNMVGCDNRPGIYVLDKLGKNKLTASILYHTNSWEIAHQGKDDITSYFFAYFADKP